MSPTVKIYGASVDMNEVLGHYKPEQAATAANRKDPAWRKRVGFDSIDPAPTREGAIQFTDFLDAK